ncbi:MATE family efflux transporter [Chelatococcus sp. GW1]|uniref:MATE family efflux transporter n=1 Tax=unclassified Chelatococcus TaxID=2638111 RepID=UPI0002DC9F77
MSGACADPAIAPRRIETTHRRIVLLALPMMLSHVTTPLLGLVDATVIGRLGEAHLLGAVAIGGVIFDFLFWSFAALRMGTAGLTAQAYGRGDDREIDRVLARALAIAALAGAALVLLQWPVGLAIFALVGASSAVTDAAWAYYDLRIWSAPFAFANYAILGSVIGRGRTDLGLVLQVSINVVNIALTLVLVAGLGLGVRGAALGTLLAEAAGVGLGLVVLARLGSRPFAVPRMDLLEREKLLAMLGLNADIVVRTVALLLAFGVFTAYGARQGDVTLAANAVLYNMFLIGGYFLDGFATATEQLCGQALGSRDARGFRRATGLALFWCLLFGAGSSLLFLAFGNSFIDFISTNAEVRAAARDFLVFAALTPVVGAAAFTFDGVYIGATWGRAMRNLMLIAFAIFLATFLVLLPLGNAGLWTALLVFLAVRGIGQGLLFPRLARASFPPAAG